MFKFDQEWISFLQNQMQAANGRRLERLKKNLIGEKKMFQEVLWPVFQSFNGFHLEYELKSILNVNIYVDAVFEPLKIAFESEGFVPHAENITRERFSFERMRIRTLALYGYKYIPFTWDELDKQADKCQRSVYELLGRYSSSNKRAFQELTAFERELIRYVLQMHRPFQLQGACYCLGLGTDASRRVLRTLMKKELIKPVGLGKQKIRYYELDERAKDYIL